MTTFSLPTRWPLAIWPKSCTFGRDRNDEIQTSSRSRTETLIVKGRPLWTCDMTFERIPDKDDGYLWLLIESLKGHQKSIEVFDFRRPLPRGAGTYSIDNFTQPESWLSEGGEYPFVFDDGTYGYWGAADGFGYCGLSTSYPAGTTAISVTGMGESQTVLRMGDYVQIANRLYLVMNDVVTDSSGVGSITLQNGLVTAVTSAAKVYIRYAACEMRLKDQSYSGSRSAGDAFNTFSVSMIETVKDFPLISF